MKLKAIFTAVLATTTMGLSVARPGLAQTDLNAQLQQAVCSQNWSQAVQVVDQMKKVSAPEYTSQLTMYRGRLEALANSGARVPSGELNCSAGSTAIASNSNSNNATTKTAYSNSSATDQAFVEYYTRLATRESNPKIKAFLLDMAQNSPESSISMAKQVCSNLRAGFSWDEIRDVEIKHSLPHAQEYSFADYAILNVLAPTYYCPELASR